MTESPTLADETILDLADVDLDDTTLVIEPTAIEPPAVPVPESAPTPTDTPAVTVGRVVDFAYSLLEKVDTLPALNDRLAEIQDATKAIYAEYSAGISAVNKRFSTSLAPLDAERKNLDEQVAVGEAAQKRLAELAGLIQAPTTNTFH